MKAKRKKRRFYFIVFTKYFLGFKSMGLVVFNDYKHKRLFFLLK